MTTGKLPRKFIMPDDKEVNDPNPALSIDEIKKLFVAQYPELINSSHMTEIKDDVLNVKFKDVMYQKG